MIGDEGHSSSKAERENQPGGAPTQRQPLTVPLERAANYDPGLVGGKAANLAILIAGRLPVPPGFCVTTAAFRLFLDSSPALCEWLRRAAQDVPGETSPIRNAQPAAAEVLAPAQIPADVEDAILSAWRAMGEEGSYAVRSSATVEDGKEHSFAGQFESLLNVRGRDALLSAIWKCWVSAFSPRALRYHAAKRLRVDQTAVAVVVQEMVPAETAGVVFTMDPLSGDRGRLVLEAVPGLGDALVSGKVRPEHFVLEKRSGRLVAHQAGSGPPCVSEKLWRKVSELALRAEELFGNVLDIEWAAVGDRLLLLQARPVTGAHKTLSWEDRQRWSNVNTGEVFPDVATPITWSVVQSLFEPLFGSLFRLTGADLSRVTIGGLVAGRIYFNVNTGLALLRPFRFLIGGLANVAHAVGGGRPSEYMHGLLEVPEADIPDSGFRWYKFVLTWPRILYDLLMHAPWLAEGWLRRVRIRTDRLVGQDVESMTAKELFACLWRVRSEGFQDWDLLFLITQAPALPILAKACRSWLKKKDMSLGHSLFVGLGGIPEAEAGLALWRLAMLAKSDRELERLIQSDGDWAQLQPRLAATDRGFLRAWADFMAKHGHHCRGELELINPRWNETPDYILRVVRAYLQNINGAEPEEKQRRLAEERRKLTAECRLQLGPVKRWLFSFALERAQKLTILREGWKNEAVRIMAFLRRVLLALGRRLKEQGVLDQVDEIFFLEIGEVGGLAENGAAFDVRKLIKPRLDEYRRNLELSPPSAVVGRFTPESSLNTGSCAQSSGKMLEGIAVSAGVATGRARVILRTDFEEQLLPGEILVAPFTDPAWVPYFIPAAGIVVEQGGVLSHGSILARELGLPAVTDTGSATQLIRTGDLVQVDGNLGRVTIIESAKQLVP